MTEGDDELSGVRHFAAGLRTVRNIAVVWGLTAHEEALLLRPQIADTLAQSTHALWPAHKEALDRLSAILGIYASLENLLPSRSATWIRANNDAIPFYGRSALELMMSDKLDDVISVRRYLDAQLA